MTPTFGKSGMKHDVYWTKQPPTDIYYTNYRVAVGPLKGQGWEPKRPTLPKLRLEKTMP